MKKFKAIIAVCLLLTFAASNTALLPTVVAAVTWLDHDHAVSLVATDGHLDIVLSHSDGETHAAARRADSQHKHEHGWMTEMMVSLAAPPTPDCDHVIHFTLSGQISPGHVNYALPVVTPTVALGPPMVQILALPTLSTVQPVAAARPPPVSELLLSLRTIVLLV